MLDRHLDEIAEADLDIIVVVNPGCYRQLQQGVKRRGSDARPPPRGAAGRREMTFTPGGTVVLHNGVGILADEGAGAACWAV